LHAGRYQHQNRNTRGDGDCYQHEVPCRDCHVDRHTDINLDIIGDADVHCHANSGQHALQDRYDLRHRCRHQLPDHNALTHSDANSLGCVVADTDGHDVGALDLNTHRDHIGGAHSDQDADGVGNSDEDCEHRHSDALPDQHCVAHDASHS